MEHLAIDLVALGGKIAIEATSMERSLKEDLKLSINCVAKYIKQMQPPQQKDFSVMGFSLDYIQAIKKAAPAYEVDCVILFPGIVKEKLVPVLKIKGKKIADFCNAIGVLYIEPSGLGMPSLEQEELIRRYGVILYQRDI